MDAEVCGIIPRGQEKVYQNLCIEVSVTADRPCISEIEIEPVQCPVLYIAGDSTVTDQSAEYPYAPGASYAGWGQMLPFFISGEMTVSNPLLDFIVFLMRAYGSRKTFPAVQPCPYDSTVSKYLQPYVSAACQLHVLAADGTDALEESISRKQGSDICRNLKII